MKNKFLGFTILVFIFCLICSSAALAMGEAPATKETATVEQPITEQATTEQPKYQVKILKMEMIPAPAPSAETKTQTPSAKKVLMVIAPENFHDEELSTPKELLELKGIKVTVASATSGTANGMYGAKVKPDILLKDAQVADYDAVVFVGGNGASVYFDDATAHGLAIAAQKQNKILAAICVAPVILGKAGLLEGKQVTASPFSVIAIKAAGATYTSENVEVDGKIITGKGPGAAPEFGMAILGALQKE